MTVYVCSCGSTHEFMSLAVLCTETHTVGAAVELTAHRRAVAPVLRRAT